MQGGSARGVALTAYVVITLLENSDIVDMVTIVFIFLPHNAVTLHYITSFNMA